MLLLSVCKKLSSCYHSLSFLVHVSESDSVHPNIPESTYVAEPYYLNVPPESYFEYLALLFRKRYPIYISNKWYQEIICNKSTRSNFSAWPLGAFFLENAFWRHSGQRLPFSSNKTFSPECKQTAFCKIRHPPGMSKNYWQTLLLKVTCQTACSRKGLRSLLSKLWIHLKFLEKYSRSLVQVIGFCSHIRYALCS